MSAGPQETGWMLTATQTMVALWAWLAVALVHGLVWRSLRRPEPDPIRPPGPVDPSA